MQSPLDRAARTPIDPIVVIAVACVLAGWFWLNLCVTKVGRLELDFHFYEMSELIRRPALLLTGVSDRHSARSIAFGFVCVVVALASLAPYVRKSKNAWLATLAPLVLMLLCGALLYYKTSPDYFSASADAGEVGRDLIQLANKLAGKMVGNVARHVSIGLGAYVSFLASGVIAIRGWLAR